ncbi:DUF839 domain-containing protein [filamentous cyanobacterium LEGE 11480]|uniref:DUF839 domain-containing protein n=1 Tax=Romeriopsis navalis LEGE 11480 TaxID=2777977 RepID=A0A928Z325_9CYAN|nr:alkaline phosphatase PhoX [Romeriopsis navalis]MBE9028743.1 DUF839 domain-containing protein [Romeriopsis navalis LEGE 11480]
MSLKRREFLMFMGAACSTAALPACRTLRSHSGQIATATTTKSGVGFNPVQGPLPLETSAVEIAQQVKQLAQYVAPDDLLVPEGYSYQIIGSWGDKIGDSRFGYNNDYLSFVETSPNKGFLSINFEYVSTGVWLQTYEQIIGSKLPLEEILQQVGQQAVDAFALPPDIPLKQQIATICEAALIDQGLGIISIQRNANGQWERTNSTADRRITGVSGLKDGRYAKCSGPARHIFRKKSGQGYIDKLGDKIIGTFGNCAGGTTPWGTVLTAEENFQSQVPEPVYADGTAFAPKTRPASIRPYRISGQGNVFGLAGNKYGWIMEVDPANPQDYGTKHTWLGRYRHEAVGVRVSAGQPIAFYSGCDRKGGHVYKFVSQGKVKNPQDKANSQLLTDGMLYVAQFNPDGTGKWIPLQPDTPVAPVLPSQNIGGKVMLPNRPNGGSVVIDSDAQAKAFAQKYKTLGDLYVGNADEKQGAILIDAHYAANACGGTCTARPEDTEVAPDGSLYIAFTAGTASKNGDGPNQQIFQGPKGEVPYFYGFIMHLTEAENAPDAMTFKWEMLALGGDPAKGGAGFSNPDNLLVDRDSNIWVVTDMGSSHRFFGNDGVWMIPSQGPGQGKAHLFALGPMECEVTGPFMSQDQKTLFLSVQHPGEKHGTRKNMAITTAEFTISTPDGKQFKQQRQLPLGSNFPSNQVNQPPKPSVVAIVKDNNKMLTEA